MGRSTEQTDSTLVGHEPCDKCGSSDALARYDDGHGYCFSCGGYDPGDAGSTHSGGSGVRNKAKPDEEDGAEHHVQPGQTSGLSIEGEYADLPKRRIKAETCKRYGYRVGERDGRSVHYAYYYDDDVRPLACKLRYPDKSFKFIGEPKRVGLFGQHLFRHVGKRLVITEGEIDCLSVAQTQGLQWPCVSVPNGAQGAAKSIKANLAWIEGFDLVVFAFDMDEPGRAAAKECAKLLPPGRAAIANWPEGFKDPSDLLQAGKAKELLDALWGAKPFRPDGIRAGAEIELDGLLCGVTGYATRYPKLDAMIAGLREAELTLLTAGSGIGKSTFARELAYGLQQDHGLLIGNIYLEENNKKTAQGYIALDNDVPLGALRRDPTIIEREAWAKSKANVVDRMFFYEHFGSMESDHLLDKIRYMRVALGVNFVILDHISIVVSGQTGSGEGERKDIDVLMTKLRSLCEETGVGIIAIVHLRQPEGKAHEEGGRVTLSQLRGSGSLKQLSDNVVAIERNQQDEDEANRSSLRVLKCREFGETGLADELEYNKKTGRLLPCDSEF